METTNKKKGLGDLEEVRIKNEEMKGFVGGREKEVGQGKEKQISKLFDPSPCRGVLPQ